MLSFSTRQYRQYLLQLLTPFGAQAPQPPQGVTIYLLPPTSCRPLFTQSESTANLIGVLP